MTTTDVEPSATEALAGRIFSAGAEILPVEHPVWRLCRLTS